MNDDALKKLWQEQPLDPARPVPATEQIAGMKRMMNKFNRTIQWRDVGESFAAVIVIVIFSFFYFTFKSPVSRLGCVITILSSIFVIWYMLWNKWRDPKAEPNAPVMEGVKVELQKVNTQIRLLKSVLWWYILPISIGGYVFFLGTSRSLAADLGYLVFCVVMDAGIYWLNQRAVRRYLLPLRQELEALLDPEKQVAAPPPISAPSDFVRKLKHFGIGVVCGSALTLACGLSALNGKIGVIVAVIVLIICPLMLLFMILRRPRTRSFAWGVVCGIAIMFSWAHHLNSAPKAVIGPGGDLKDFLKQTVDINRRTPGIVVGIIDENGQRVTAYGKVRDGSEEAVNGDTLFEIGSITKVFTSLILADMVEHGEVKLDDPISKFLPATVKVPNRGGKQITLLDLSTHTSALPRLPGNMNGFYLLQHMDNPYAEYTVQQMYDFLSSYELPRDIGTKYEYSNLGGGLLGHVLALKAGTNYEALVKQRICTPLGMTNTGITLTPEQKKSLAQGHNSLGTAVSNWDMPTLAGAGALRSSVNDLLKLLAANLDLKPTDLKPTLELATKPERDTGRPGVKIGLGWHITTKNDVEVIWHNGQTGGYHSFIGFNRKTHRGVVVLSNSDYSIDDIGIELLHSSL